LAPQTAHSPSDSLRVTTTRSARELGWCASSAVRELGGAPARRCASSGGAPTHTVRHTRFHILAREKFFDLAGSRFGAWSRHRVQAAVETDSQGRLDLATSFVWRSVDQ
jgi:hypothetical protein